MGVTAVPGQMGKGLWHEGRAEPVGLRDLFDHELEERQPVCGHQRFGIVPVDLELPVRVFVVVLVGSPAQVFHVAADLGDYLVAAHQSGLIVAGLGLGIACVRDVLAVCIDQVKLGFNPGHQNLVVPQCLRLKRHQHVAGCLRHGAPVHPGIACDPGELWLPGQLDHAGGIGVDEHVGVRRRHIEPGGEACKPRAGFLHVAHSACRHQLGALDAEKIGEVEQEKPRSGFLCEF